MTAVRDKRGRDLRVGDRVSTGSGPGEITGAVAYDWGPASWDLAWVRLDGGPLDWGELLLRSDDLDLTERNDMQAATDKHGQPLEPGDPVDTPCGPGHLDPDPTTWERHEYTPGDVWWEIPCAVDDHVEWFEATLLERRQAS